jgi:hypothetical protein
MYPAFQDTARGDSRYSAGGGLAAAEPTAEILRAHPIKIIDVTMQYF